MDSIIYEGIIFKIPNFPVEPISKYHSRVQFDLKAGKLTRKPCEICGIEKTHAHHEFYGNESIIRWLCHQHHLILHKMISKINIVNNGTVIQLSIPASFSYKLDTYLLELKRDGVKKSKATLIMELAEQMLLKKTVKKVIE
jgi:hypothetical protein